VNKRDITKRRAIADNVNLNILLGLTSNQPRTEAIVVEGMK